MNKVVLAERTTLAMKRDSNNTDKPIYKKLTRKADGPFRIISVQQHTLPIDKNGVANTISMNPSVHAPFRNTNA